MLSLALGLPAPAMAGAFEDFFKAVKLNDADGLRDLLQRGLDPNLIEAERGDTGLILALREGASGVIKVLLAAPATDIEITSRNGDSALMIAAYKGNREAVRALLERGAMVNRPGWTALHYAAAAGDETIVRLLLDKAAYIDAESPNGTTPIMMAAMNGHIYTVKLLLDEGADATLRNQVNMSAIDFANAYGHRDIAEGLAYRLKKAGKL
jgi:uncharacterized protein